MNRIGSFCLIRNEAKFIKAHLKSWLPHLSQMVFYDGNSTDGTLDIIKDAMTREYGHKIKLREDKDPINLTDSYISLSNSAMWDVDCDMAVFLHPDMFYNGGGKELPKDCAAASINIRSFAGEPDGNIYEIKGRGTKWKNIYRLRNPDIGAHYFGAYGAHNEDTYFSEITGESHEHYGQAFERYPYEVADSGIEVLHYSDVRPYSRRLERMTRCLINQGYSPEKAAQIAPNHPRVSLKDGAGFSFSHVETPVFLGDICEG